MGFAPDQVGRMTPWEFTACLDRYGRMNGWDMGPAAPAMSLERMQELGIEGF